MNIPKIQVQLNQDLMLCSFSGRRLYWISGDACIFPKYACIAGYKRYCGFIQFVQRVEHRNECENRTKLFLDVDDYFNQTRNPYFSYGYPASLFDAPCKNLGNCDRLTWTAFTYLVDMPTRMNHNELKYIKVFHGDMLKMSMDQ